MMRRDLTQRTDGASLFYLFHVRSCASSAPGSTSTSSCSGSAAVAAAYSVSDQMVFALAAVVGVLSVGIRIYLSVATVITSFFLLYLALLPVLLASLYLFYLRLIDDLFTFEAFGHSFFITRDPRGLRIAPAVAALKLARVRVVGEDGNVVRSRWLAPLPEATLFDPSTWSFHHEQVGGGPKVGIRFAMIVLHAAVAVAVMYCVCLACHTRTRNSLSLVRTFLV